MRGFSPGSGKRAAVSFLQELGSAPEAACTPLRVNIWTIPFSRSTRDVNGMYKRRRLAQAGRRVRAEVVGSAAWARSSCDKRLARIVVEVANTRPGVEPRLHNVYRLSCTARAYVPKPERRAGCRREVAKPRLPNCNRRDAVTLAMT